jgi:hypothetical protein
MMTGFGLSSFGIERSRAQAPGGDAVACEADVEMASSQRTYRAN